MMHWLIKFADIDICDLVLTDEAAARKSYESHSQAWNCTLFVEQAALNAKEARIKALEQELEQLREKQEEYFRLQCPLSQPSCLMCGQVKDFAIKHLQLGAIGICADCVALPKELERVKSNLQNMIWERDDLLDQIGKLKQAYADLLKALEHIRLDITHWRKFPSEQELIANIKTRVAQAFLATHEGKSQ